MRELFYEILLRFPKPIIAAFAGLVIGLIAIAFMGATPSAEFALLCWISGAVLILLVQEGPI